jgi:hypothetical protein
MLTLTYQPISVSPDLVGASGECLQSTDPLLTAVVLLFEGLNALG